MSQIVYIKKNSLLFKYGTVYDVIGGQGSIKGGNFYMAFPVEKPADGSLGIASFSKDDCVPLEVFKEMLIKERFEQNKDETS